MDAERVRRDTRRPAQPGAESEAGPAPPVVDPGQLGELAGQIGSGQLASLAEVGLAPVGVAAGLLGRFPGGVAPPLRSARFRGDPVLEQVRAGTDVLTRGSRGDAVTRLQQAMIDLELVLPRFGVDGKFEAETAGAVADYQASVPLPGTGVFDAATLLAMDAQYVTKAPYLDDTVLDPAHPDEGVRQLSAADRSAAHEAMVPERGTGGTPATFVDDVGGERYGPAIRTQLSHLIAEFHQSLYADRLPQRADPDNLFSFADLERTLQASTQVTDDAYGSYAQGPAFSQASGNLADQFEHETAAVARLSPAERKAQARDLVGYLISANCTEINRRHSARPSEPTEAAILAPIIDSFVDTAAKVRTLNEIDIGWEGVAQAGQIRLQRFKAATDEQNRAILWDLFHTGIHEYLHTLAHPRYQAAEAGLGRAGDADREHTLAEGFCDFFTENVRAGLRVTATLRQQVEGTFYDPAVPPPQVRPATYDAKAEAERVVAVVGIRNAQEAYFHGRVELIGL